MFQHNAQRWTVFFVLYSLVSSVSSFSTQPLHFGLRNQEAVVPSSSICHAVKNNHNSNVNVNDMNRRSVFSQITNASLLSILTITTPTPAIAKTKEPVTKESMAAAFADIHYELENPDGGINKLENAIQTKNWDDVKGFTKFYDLEFRKAKMVKARKMFPDADMRGETLALCNNVTFDLIGINRASRVENVDEAIKYLGELKEDIRAFLAYEDKVVIP